MLKTLSPKQLRKKSRFKIWSSLALILFGTLPAWSQFANTAFYRHRVSSLKFTTSSQTLLASLCSGVVTVQTQNASGAASNVPSNLSVTLSGSSGVTFYSDSDCTASLNSLTISSGANSANFYLMSTSTGTATVTASATGFVSATQSETINTNGFIWTGAGGNATWGTDGNWSGGFAPGSNDIAVFNSDCVSNCSPNIASNINVKGVRLQSTYAGTITQGSGFTVTVGTKGWVQTTGNFVGSSSGDAMTFYEIFNLAGGTFKATSGNFSVQLSSPYAAINYAVSGSASFLANAGSLILDSGCGTSHVTFSSATYNHVTFKASAGCPGFVISDSTVTIAGNLSLQNFAYGGSMNGGTLLVGGDLNLTGPDVRSGSTVIKLTGNPSGQKINSTNSGTVKHLTIDTGTNPVTFNGDIFVLGNYNFISSGTFTPGPNTLVFNADCASYSVNPGSVSYNSVKFYGTCSNYDFGNKTMTINGDLTLMNPNYGASMSNGTLLVAGNVSATGPTSWSGSALVKLVGRVSGQTITGSSTGYLPNLTIDVGANPLTISGSVVTASYIVASSGSITTAGSSVRVMGPTLTPGSESYNDFTVGGNCTGLTLTGTLKVLGKLTYNEGCAPWIGGGTIVASGNVEVVQWPGGGSGTTNLTLNGTTQQTITQPSGHNFPGGVITLDNPAGLLLTSNLSMPNSSLSFVINQGNVTMNGNSWYVYSLTLNSHSVTRGGGTLTVNGSVVPGGTQSLYGGTVNP